MKAFYLKILMTFLLSPAMALACHNSEFNLLSVQNLGNDQYEFEVQFCVGHGCDSTGVGAIGYTHTWAVFVDDASVISFPATLTSPATGAEFTGSNTIYGDTVLIYDRQSVLGWDDTWACIEHTCGPVGQFCISFSFITQGYPSSLVLGGAEGMGVGVEPYGCNGNDDMRIDLLQPQADAGADQDVIYGYGSSCVDFLAQLQMESHHIHMLGAMAITRLPSQFVQQRQRFIH